MKSALASLPVLLFCVLISCHNAHSDSYAVRDFDKKLQPYLTKVVATGVVGYDSVTRYVKGTASDKELEWLSKSEHPVLRAIALEEMLKRPSFDHFAMIMGHLDDTAMVAVDWGEFGIKPYRVSDNMLHNGHWKDSVAKNKTIEEIILKHNYLNAAYTKATAIRPNETLYASIKEMALRKRNYNGDYGEMNFDEIERALYALAKFRKPGDVPIIKQLLLENSYRTGKFSFKLMQENPEEAYWEILQQYFPKEFYRRTCDDRFPDAGEDFINAVAAYKNDSSAKILKVILDRKPFMPCLADTNYLKHELACAIWNNECLAYSGMRKQVEHTIIEDKKNAFEFPVEPLEIERAVSNEPAGWW